MNFNILLFSLSISIPLICCAALSCQGLQSQPLTLVPICEVEHFSVENKVEYIELKCEQLVTGNGTGLKFKLRAIEKSTVATDKTQFLYCAGFETVSSFHMIKLTSTINHIEITPQKGDYDRINNKETDDYAEEDDDADGGDEAGKVWSAGFSNSIPIGSVVVNKTCIAKYINTPLCRVELRLKPNIYNLAIFHFKPSNKLFWNFTDPLLESNGDWLRTLKTHKYKYDLRFLKALGNTSLQELMVSGNDENIGQVFLGKMSHLKKLHLQNGNLDTFNSGNCKDKISLVEISLLNNQLEGIPPGLSSCKELRILDVSMQPKGSVFVIDHGELLNMSKLEELNLSETKIGNINEQFLPGLSTLKRLNLSNCEIQSIQITEPFKQIPKLETLDLSMNSIPHLSKLFLTKSNLKVLRILSSEIESLGDLFIENQDLEMLDLSGNSISNFPVLKSCKIDKFNLSGNSIGIFENPSKNGIRIRYLDLSQITYFTNWTDKNLFKNLQFSKESKSDFVNLKSWVSVLNLTGNGITALTEDMMTSLGFLSEVDLGGIEIMCDDCLTIRNLTKWIDRRSKPTKIVNFGTMDPFRCKYKNTTLKQFSDNCYTISHGGRPIFSTNLEFMSLIFLFALMLN